MRRSLVRALVSGITVCTLYASPAAAQAPGEPNPGEIKGSKRLLYAVIGAVVTAVPTYLVADRSPGGGTCSSQTCLTTLGVILGGGVGYLIGFEHDRKHTRMLALGPTLKTETPPVRIPLTLVPERMTSFGAGAVVTGLAGANLVYADGRVLPRAAGIRGIEDAVVLAPEDLVVFATGSGLLAFPLSGDSALGSLLDRTGGSAIEAVDSELAVGDASEIRLLRIDSADGQPTAERVAAVASGGPVSDLKWNSFARVAWALVADRLVAFAPGTLERLGEVQLPGPGLTVRVAGDRAVVAAGAHGVVLVDIADPAAPRVVQTIQGIRFAYAADLYARRLHVAAGPEGVVVIDVSDESRPRVLGVIRSAQFALDVFAEGGRVWVLDRLGRKVEIADLTAPETAAR